MAEAKNGKKKEDKKAIKSAEKVASKGPAIHLDPPAGTRDFFPADMRMQNYIYGKWKETARLYGFQMYDAPVLEHEELYKRKAGEEITEQMYNFEDKEGYKVTLRPEMTPSLARMVLSLMRAETGEMAALLPLKWFSIPQCWRFETCQRGRKREHYQWNMDIVGISTIHAEVELLSAICTFFQSVGITSQDVGIKVNSRKVLGAVLRNSGVPDQKFTETCVVIDKLDKIGAEEVVKLLVAEPINLEKAVAERIVHATSAKTLDEFANLAGVGESDEVKELRLLFKLAEDEGFGDWLMFDASVIRGLAYYTGVVFEGFDRAGVLRAICGGGRYDRLLTLYGSPKEVPCCGFGFGDCVIYELLKEKKVTPELPHMVDFVVVAYENMMGQALHVARQLRKAGQSVDVFSEETKKVHKGFKYADRVNATRVAFVAPGEWDQGLVTIKDLRNFKEDDPKEVKQKDIPLQDLANFASYFQLPGAPAPTPAAAPAAMAVATAAAPSKGPNGSSDLEATLADQPYLSGYTATAADRQLYEKMKADAGCPSSTALRRWYLHIGSFSQSERLSWK